MGFSRQEYWSGVPLPSFTSFYLVCFKMKIMASGPITSWEIDGETVETVSDFIFLGSKITVDGDCSYEIKRRLLLGRKVMTNLDSILKSRDIILSTEVPLVKVVAFPVATFLVTAKLLLLLSRFSCVQLCATP